jgi:release factor glutamine methyltransferase
MFRGTATGTIVPYLDKIFIVHQNVFWPGDDSKPLVKNYVVHPGEAVLDLCTGSGVIAVYSAYKGASRVVALDKNPDAVANARENAERFGYSQIIEVRESDMFAALAKDERFDVITMNPPFVDHVVDDVVSNSTWDSELHVHKEFFAHAPDHLKPEGRCYLAQANFGAVDEMKQLAQAAGFTVQELASWQKPFTDLVFYAFEFRLS